MRAAILTSSIGFAAVLAGCGITGNFRNDPGFADFASPGWVDTNRDLGLSLGPLPLKLAHWVLDDDPELGPLVRDLRAVRVYCYEVSGDAERVARRIEATDADLRRAGWVALAAVREDQELVSVLVRYDGHAVRGMAVLTQDDSEVLLVNLIGGDLAPGLINFYMAELDVEMPAITIDAASLQAQAR